MVNGKIPKILMITEMLFLLFTYPFLRNMTQYRNGAPSNQVPNKNNTLQMFDAHFL